MSMISDDVIPICYRCDQKYIHFLHTSIESVLRYHKGNKRIKFYICTNEVLDLSYIHKLKTVYDFDYETVYIDGEFLKKNKIDEAFGVVVNRKYLGLNFTNVKERGVFNFNPFSGSKTIACLTIFFGATTKHEKFIHLDTDTLVITDIEDLFNIDVSEVYLAACEDWDGGENHTAFNSAVSIINARKFQESLFDNIKQYMPVLENTTTYTNNRPFTEAFNIIYCNIVGTNWKLLDREWNVPLTHIDVFPAPKIFHFAESWSGNKQVFDSYYDLVSKYLDIDVQQNIQ